MLNGNLESSSNVLGLNSIVNKNTINKSVNLKSEEIDLLSSISSLTNTKSKVFQNELYNKNIKDIANEVGIDLDNISNIFDDNRENKIEKEEIIDMFKKDFNKDFDNVSNISKLSNASIPKRNDYPSLQERFFNRANNENNGDPTASGGTQTKFHDDKEQFEPNEQHRHDTFNNVINNIQSNTNYSHDIFTEDIKNQKSGLLEQIQLLKLMLLEENEDVSNIPDLNENDSIDRLEHIYKILKIKKDRIQFSTLGEELIMFGVHIIESIFDGEREFFGLYKPNLTGWHNSVQIKLRRLRYETSTVVSDVVQSYNISYGTRLAIELIPSLFLYSKIKTACANKYSKNNFEDNLSQINI